MFEPALELHSSTCGHLQQRDLPALTVLPHSQPPTATTVASACSCSHWTQWLSGCPEWLLVRVICRTEAHRTVRQKQDKQGEGGQSGRTRQKQDKQAGRNRTVRQAETGQSDKQDSQAEPGRNRTNSRAEPGQTGSAVKNAER